MRRASAVLAAIVLVAAEVVLVAYGGSRLLDKTRSKPGARTSRGSVVRGCTHGTSSITLFYRHGKLVPARDRRGKVVPHRGHLEGCKPGRPG